VELTPDSLTALEVLTLLEMDLKKLARTVLLLTIVELA
jgi:hypothetical protein